MCILLAATQPTVQRNLDYFLRGEADIGQFAKEVALSYQTHLTHPDFMRPLEGNITSPFGERISPITSEKEHHTGLDIDTTAGTEVRASATGTISKVGVDERFGNYIIITHNPVFSSCYAHLESAQKAEGETVQQGDIIGIAGQTGNTTGPHLHFEIRKGEQRVNPVPYLPQ